MANQPQVHRQLSVHEWRVITALAQLEARLWRWLATGQTYHSLSSDLELAESLSEWYEKYQAAKEG